MKSDRPCVEETRLGGRVIYVALLMTALVTSERRAYDFYDSCSNGLVKDSSEGRHVCGWTRKTVKSHGMGIP